MKPCYCCRSVYFFSGDSAYFSSSFFRCSQKTYTYMHLGQLLKIIYSSTCNGKLTFNEWVLFNQNLKNNVYFLCYEIRVSYNFFICIFGFSLQTLAYISQEDKLDEIHRLKGYPRVTWLSMEISICNQITRQLMTILRHITSHQ